MKHMAQEQTPGEVRSTRVYKVISLARTVLEMERAIRRNMMQIWFWTSQQIFRLSKYYLPTSDRVYVKS